MTAYFHLSGGPGGVWPWRWQQVSWGEEEVGGGPKTLSTPASHCLSSLHCLLYISRESREHAGHCSGYDPDPWFDCVSECHASPWRINSWDRV